jgi:hypothetical protein
VDGFTLVEVFICLDVGDGGTGEDEDPTGLEDVVRFCDELPPHSDMKERTVKERTERSISECWQDGGLAANGRGRRGGGAIYLFLSAPWSPLSNWRLV